MELMQRGKKIDRSPFDMAKPPRKQNPFLLPLIWGGSFLMTRRSGLTIEKKNMEGIKPPYLVIATHQGFSDYYIAPLALFPHRGIYVSDMEGFAAFGDWLYRAIGCIGKRRYVSDLAVVRNMRKALQMGQSVVVYPESRHSNVGTTAYIPKNMGKLARQMEVPVVTLSVHGSYLANPFWDEERTRKVPMEATLQCIYTREELKKTEETAIQERIEEVLSYDEYAWQREKKIPITEKYRAEGLQMPLYQCIHCGTKYQMNTTGAQLFCKKCGTTWNMDEYGTLHKKAGQEIFIPDWYEWERAKVEQERSEGQTDRAFQVRVEALYNARGFVKLGDGCLKQDATGFTLEVEGKSHRFQTAGRESVQTEYNYRGKGPCIVLSDQNCCYYIYSEDPSFSPTEIQFAGEYDYQKLIEIYGKNARSMVD